MCIDLDSKIAWFCGNCRSYHCCCCCWRSMLIKLTVKWDHDAQVSPAQRGWAFFFSVLSLSSTPELSERCKSNWQILLKINFKLNQSFCADTSIRESVKRSCTELSRWKYFSMTSYRPHRTGHTRSIGLRVEDRERWLFSPKETFRRIFARTKSSQCSEDCRSWTHWSQQWQARLYSIAL